MTNLSMFDTESKLFSYKVDKKKCHENVGSGSSSGGKEITTLKQSARNTLTETMDSFPLRKNVTSIDPVMTPYEPIESVCVYPELINH